MQTIGSILKTIIRTWYEEQKLAPDVIATSIVNSLAGAVPGEDYYKILEELAFLSRVIIESPSEMVVAPQALG